MQVHNGSHYVNMGDIVALLKANNLPVTPARVYRAKKKWTSATAQENVSRLMDFLEAKANGQAEKSQVQS